MVSSNCNLLPVTCHRTRTFTYCALPTLTSPYLHLTPHPYTLAPTGRLFVGNVGDSRVVVCRNGRAINMSTDHKATSPSEVARVIEAGGFVAKRRLLGQLAITRALGDANLKRPESAGPKRQPESEADTDNSLRAALTAVPDVQVRGYNEGNTFELYYHWYTRMMS